MTERKVNTAVFTEVEPVSVLQIGFKTFDRHLIATTKPFFEPETMRSIKEFVSFVR